MNQFVSAESRNKVVLKENLDVHVCISINSYMYGIRNLSVVFVLTDCDPAELQQRALTMAISHLIYTDLRSNHNRPYKWKAELENVRSWKRRKGNVIPVQYCHARLCQYV